jgi:hypothetical protein
MSSDERQEIDQDEIGFVSSHNSSIHTQTMALENCVQALRSAYEVSGSIKYYWQGKVVGRQYKHAFFVIMIRCTG